MEPLIPPTDLSRLAWAQFRRMMRWAAVVTLATVVAVLGVFYWADGLVSIHFFIAIGVGLAAAMMLTGALMGLIFVSNASGHDADVARAQNKRWWIR